MDTALVVGGTRFIGRHVVSELLAHDYDVTLVTRGNHPNPFADHDRVDHVQGDRTDDATMERAAETVEPDVVVDSVAFFPADVETAVDVFADADAYVYISSVGAYDHDYVLKEEGRTPLEPCSAAESTDDSFETYAARKAEGDRVVFEAAESGVDAMSVRPTMVYGPHNHLDFLQYWLDRAVNEDRVLVPGDGSYVCHRTYVEDVAAAVRVVLEEGEAGEAYNVADQRPLTMAQTLDLVGEVSGREVDPVYASERELAEADLSRADFPLYMDLPFVMSTEKLAALGWESTPPAEAMARTLEYHRESGLADHDAGPSIETERRLLDALS